MLSLDARFTLLAVFCGLSMQWLAPLSMVSAVAIARPYPVNHAQRVLPARAAHRRRMASNPFSKFAGAVYSGLKHKGHRKRAHKSIIIPNTQGGTYVVPHPKRSAGTPLWASNQTKASTQSENQQATPGTVGIMSHDYNSTDKLIAWLFMTKMNDTFVLNASDTNKTEMYLVPTASQTTRDPSAETSNEFTPVYLAISGLMGNNDPYCATYDPNPSNAEPMTMQKCTGVSTTDVDSNSHTSQTFMYNKTSGAIQPTWFMGEDDGTHNTTSAQAQDVSSAGNATTTTSASATDSGTSAQPTSTDLSSREDSQRNTQNVTLVFIPAGSDATASDVTNDAAQSQSSPSSAASATSAGQTSISSSISGSIAAASVGPSMSSSAASAPSQSAAGLSVELVGDGSLPQSSSASASDTVTPTASAAQSSVSSSPSSVNAAAVAASIASSASAAWSASASSSSSASTPSGSLAAASVDPSASASSSAPQDSASGTPSTATFVAAVMQRNAPEKTPVSTEPYVWRFARGGI